MEKRIEILSSGFERIPTTTKKLSEEELDTIKKGTVEDWMYEGRELCVDIYTQTKVGDKLKYEYMYRYTTTVRSQIQKGGIRLAHILNTILG